MEHSEEDLTIITSFRLAINRALWCEVIPSLRRVVMQWPPIDGIIRILFYHDGPITDAIKEHYWFIASEVECSELKRNIESDFEIIRIDYPENIPQPATGEGFTIYSRKEPFREESSINLNQ